jgi:class 3 adenylate cyclase
MRFRIGLNAGEIVEQDDGTAYGDGVNVAARLQALAEPGGIAVSEVVAAEARNKLPVASSRSANSA